MCQAIRLTSPDLTGIRDYVLDKKDYLMSQVGNPKGEGEREFLPVASTLDWTLTFFSQQKIL